MQTGPFCPPGPGCGVSSAPRPRSGRDALGAGVPPASRLGSRPRTPELPPGGGLGARDPLLRRAAAPGLSDGSRRCLCVTESHPGADRPCGAQPALASSSGCPVLPPLLNWLLSLTLILVYPGQVSPGSRQGHLLCNAILCHFCNSFFAILSDFGLDSL